MQLLLQFCVALDYAHLYCTIGAKSQNLRANLYGSLLNFLHIACHNSAENFDVDQDDSLFVSCLDASRYRNGTSDSPQRASCLSIVMSFGERLIDVLCHDCTGGHDVCKVDGVQWRRKCMTVADEICLFPPCGRIIFFKFFTNKSNCKIH